MYKNRVRKRKEAARFFLPAGIITKGLVSVHFPPCYPPAKSRICRFEMHYGIIWQQFHTFCGNTRFRQTLIDEKKSEEIKEMMDDGMRRRLEGIGDSILLAHIFVNNSQFPLILLNPCGIFLFLEIGDLRKKKEEALDEARILQAALGVVRSKMRIYSADEDGSWTWIDPQSGDACEVADPVSHAKACIESGMRFFQPERLLCFEDKLSQGRGKGMGIRTDGGTGRHPYKNTFKVSGMVCLEGRVYIRRHGRWYPASGENSDDVFRKTCLFGLFGWLQFHTGRFLSGILYALTCGFFGFGWICDLILLLAGLAKDGEGYYYAPVSDKRTGFLALLMCAATASALLAVYFWALGLLGRLLAEMYQP